MRRICDFISSQMGAIVLVVAALALFFPDFFSYIGTAAVNPLLGVVMFGMGLTLRIDDFKVVFSRPKDVIVGCLAQFTVMPSLAYLLSRLFGLDAALTVGVVLVGCCPGGTASNVITYLSKGDLALSVGMTGVSTLLAPLLTPLLTYVLVGESVDVDVVSMFLSILWVVILPIALGFVVRRFLPSFTERAVVYLPAFSVLAVATIVGIVISANSAKLLTGGLLIILVVALHNVSGLALGYAIGRILGLSHSRRVAVSVEVGMQNSGLASALAASHFAAYPLATVPGAVFSVWHNISGALVAKIFSTVRKGEQEK